MKLAIMQPYFFPYIGYWQLINVVDTFIIYDDVNYIKQGYINRNSILNNSQKQLITLEVIGASSNKKINEILVGNNTKKLLKTIQQNYNRAPQFEMIFQKVILPIMQNKEKNLAKFLGYSIQLICEYLNIDTKFIYSSELSKNNDLKAQDKVIDICKIVNADIYINAIGGMDLYEKSDFEGNGISLNFLQTEIVTYSQNNNEFIPNLSIIDILMFNSIEEINNMLHRYTLI